MKMKKTRKGEKDEEEENRDLKIHRYTKDDPLEKKLLIAIWEPLDWTVSVLGKLGMGSTSLIFFLLPLSLSLPLTQVEISQ